MTMKTFAYLRVSTDKQTVEQQLNTINEYVRSKGITIDEMVADEGISGGVSYKQRSLSALVSEMKHGDALIVSEISRLGRCMSDLNKFVNDELKPRKLRLIVVKMGIDMDCSRLTAIDEMLLFAFSFSAQLEKEMIQARTKSALDVKKRQIEEQGYFITKKGKRCEKLGGNTMTDEAREKACAKKMDKAANDPENIFFASYIRMYEKRTCKRLTADSKKTDFEAIAIELNALGKKTKTGLPYDANRTRALWVKMREREMKLNAYNNRKED